MFSLLFILLTSALILNFGGYILIIRLQALFKQESEPVVVNEQPDIYPSVYLVVPMYMESDHIAEKISNCSQLDYPNLKLIFTVPQIDNLTRIDNSQLPPNATVIRTNSTLKTAQINEALQNIPSGSIVVISDADATIENKQGIKKIVTHLLKPGIGLVGGYTSPKRKGTISLEIALWQKENTLRLLECDTYTSSIVVGPLYAFRREFLDSYPEDCIADDVYVSLLCHRKRLRVIYDPVITVTENRSPETFVDFIKIKLRKARAYSFELIRFLNYWQSFNITAKTSYLYRMFQFTLLPWVTFGYLIMIYRNLAEGEILPLAMSFLSLIATSALASSILPKIEKETFAIRLRNYLALATITVIVVLNSLTYFLRNDPAKLSDSIIKERENSKKVA